jgi:mRNA-degrading endonuclease RelE of RelBE toxin-antitoxin system
MSAAEIIEQIKRLPPEEKRAVKDFVNTEGEGTSQPEVEYIDRKSLEQTAEQIFKEHQELFRKLAE